jgi:cytochrome c biogenesis protein CcdA
MTGNLNVLFVFGAGLASVLSPCVLPAFKIDK